ncbi:MAG: tRNA (adenosine(37)-N6)-threonylcarbamoyltransferase complex ATPase subunit type 1 TsaE [Spirochaetaceae bacterium]
MIKYSKSPDESLNFGKEIGLLLKPGNIVALNGKLGSGKTVLAKGIALALDIIEDVTSPTYNIVCEYNGNIPLYHMDLYRISDYDEFEMLGVDHLVYGNGITLIEWSERIIEELPQDIITIDIEICIDDSRKIQIRGI